MEVSYIQQQCPLALLLLVCVLSCVTATSNVHHQIEPSHQAFETTIAKKSVVNPRQARQRTETLYRTVTVAVTSVAFESKPSLCISLVNATRPCTGKRTLWARDGTRSVSPSQVEKMEFSRAPIMARLNDRDYEIGPNGELITSSQEILSDAGRTTERPASSFAFWRRWNNGFSNALGLARTIVRSLTETRTMTTTYVESIGYNHFYISGCIPPVLHFPICKSETVDNPILTGDE